MIRPQLTADGRAVEIPTAAIVAAVLDAVATAYAEDADTLGLVLAEHADSIACRDHANASPTATDYGRDSASAAADETREQLLAELDADVAAPVRISRIEAFQLADHLMSLAARTASTARTTAQETAA